MRNINSCKKLYGILLSIFCHLLFFCGIFTIKYLYQNDKMGYFEVMYFRCAFSFLSIEIISHFIHAPIFSIDRSLIFSLILRWTSASIGMVFGFLGMKYNNLTINSVINCTYPIYCIIFSKIFLKDYIPFLYLILIMISLLGALIISISKSVGNNLNESKFGWIFPILAGISSSVGDIIQRKMGSKLNSIVMAHYIPIFISLLIGILAILSKQNINFSRSYNNICVIIRLLIPGVVIGIGTIIYSKAMTYENPAIIAVVGYSQLIFSILSDILVFGFENNFLEMIGSILIISGGIGISLSKIYHESN